MHAVLQKEKVTKNEKTREKKNGNPLEHIENAQMKVVDEHTQFKSKQTNDGKNCA